MSKFNINWVDAFKKFGSWTGDMLRQNSGTIVGGISMIGLALLCRKLNIPYQVLTDPFGGVKGPSYKDNTGRTASIVYIPSDAVEASIAAIYDGALNSDWDSQRCAAAKEIFEILVAQKDNTSDATKTYAITILKQLSEEMDYDSGRRTVTQIISKIGRGQF